DLLSVDFFLKRFEQAALLRASSGWENFSHRWVFAEADGLPGLIMDSFKGEEELVVFQVSTAGMENAKNEILSALEKLKKRVVIEASASSQRKTEGLTPVSRQLIGSDESALSEFAIRLKHQNDFLTMRANFSGGQKTGFFLDQQWNTNLLLQLVK